MKKVLVRYQTHWLKNNPMLQRYSHTKHESKGFKLVNHFVLFIISFLFLGACHSPAYLSKPVEFSHHVKGLVIKAGLNDGSKILGEIIEVREESMSILPIASAIDRIITVRKEDLKEAMIIIATTSDNPGSISTWAALINLTSLGHGWWIVITFPINLITTTTISNDAAKSTYRMAYPRDISWELLPKFARFPQGLPDHISLNQIK